MYRGRAGFMPQRNICGHLPNSMTNATKGALIKLLVHLIALGTRQTGLFSAASKTRPVLLRRTRLVFVLVRPSCHLFCKFRQSAGIEGVHFHDIHRTVASELGNRGATSTEISSITGHAPESNVIKTYVRPRSEAALRAAAKRKYNTSFYEPKRRKNKKFKKFKIKSAKSLI